jgi:hypothetical protein
MRQQLRRRPIRCDRSVYPTLVEENPDRRGCPDTRPSRSERWCQRRRPPLDTNLAAGSLIRLPPKHTHHVAGYVGLLPANSMLRMIVSATTDGGQAVASGTGHLGGVWASVGTRIVIHRGPTSAQRHEPTRRDTAHPRFTLDYEEPDCCGAARRKHDQPSPRRKTGILECVGTLVRLQVPTSAGPPACRTALCGNGFRYSNGVVAAAVKHRKLSRTATDADDEGFAVVVL